MLGKLIKHEFKVLSRAFIPLNLVVFVLGLLGAAMSHIFVIDLLDPSPVTALLIGLAAILLFFLVPAGTLLPFIISAVRFWQGFLSSEGYLMFTLPLTRRNLIFSKLIPATLWLMITSFVAGISVVIVFLSMVTPTNLADLFSLGQQIPNPYPALGFELGNPILLFFAQIFSLIVTAAGGILSFYVAISVAQLSNSARVFIAIAVWVGLFIAYFMGSAFVSVLWEAFFPMLANNLLITTVLSASIITVLCVVMFAITEHILTKHLNLQ